HEADYRSRRCGPVRNPWWGTSGREKEQGRSPAKMLPRELSDVRLSRAAVEQQNSLRARENHGGRTGADRDARRGRELRAEQLLASYQRRAHNTRCLPVDRVAGDRRTRAGCNGVAADLKPAPLTYSTGRNSYADHIATVCGAGPCRCGVDDRAAGKRLVELADRSGRNRAAELREHELATTQRGVITAHDLERKRLTTRARTGHEIDRTRTNGVDIRQLHDTHSGVICNETHVVLLRPGTRPEGGDC